MLTPLNVTESVYYLSIVTQHATRPQSSSNCPLISPFTSRRIEINYPWKETVCLRALRPKNPTGKLDFLSNLWALEPSRAWGHEGPSSAHQQASPYLCQWVFKKMVILSVLNRLVQYITSIGTVISQQFTVRCIHWEHRRGRRKGWGSQRDIKKSMLMLHIAVTMMQLAEEESLPGVVRKKFCSAVRMALTHSA